MEKVSSGNDGWRYITDCSFGKMEARNIEFTMGSRI